MTDEEKTIVDRVEEAMKEDPDAALFVAGKGKNHMVSLGGDRFGQAETVRTAAVVLLVLADRTGKSPSQLAVEAGSFAMNNRDAPMVAEFVQEGGDGG